MSIEIEASTVRWVVSPASQPDSFLCAALGSDGTVYVTTELIADKATLGTALRRDGKATVVRHAENGRYLPADWVAAYFPQLAPLVGLIERRVREYFAI